MFFTVPAACKNLRGGPACRGEASGHQAQLITCLRSAAALMVSLPPPPLHAQQRPTSSQPGKPDSVPRLCAACGAHSSVALVLLRCSASGEMQPSSSVLQLLATSLLPPPRAAGTRRGAGQAGGGARSAGPEGSLKLWRFPPWHPMQPTAPAFTPCKPAPMATTPHHAHPQLHPTQQHRSAPGRSTSVSMELRYASVEPFSDSSLITMPRYSRPTLMPEPCSAGDSRASG